MKAALLAILAVAVPVAAGCGGSHARAPKGAPPPPSRSELRTLTRLALGAARGAGDAHPTDGVVVPSTRKIAERVDAGAVVDSNQPVYFLLVHGHFTGDSAPSGAALPTGTILTLTVDPKTNRSTDGGIESGMPNLDAIGRAQPLPLPRDMSDRGGRASRARAAIRVAHASNPGLFEIFPRAPGETRCVIPVIEGLRESSVGGTCRTRVTQPVTHRLHDEVFVTFGERWARRHRSSWTLIVRLSAAKVLATRLHGDPAPQLRYTATDSVQRLAGSADTAALRAILNAR